MQLTRDIESKKQATLNFLTKRTDEEFNSQLKKYLENPTLKRKAIAKKLTDEGFRLPTGKPISAQHVSKCAIQMGFRKTTRRKGTLIRKEGSSKFLTPESRLTRQGSSTDIANKAEKLLEMRELMGDKALVVALKNLLGLNDER